MKLTELLFFAVLGWTSIGVVGIAISLLRGRGAEARSHAAWIAGVIGAYMLALLTVSALQPQKLVPLGSDQCFDDMCFAVTGSHETPGSPPGDQDQQARFIRVAIRVTNHGRTAHSESLIRAYLIDSGGRTFDPIPGLSGNRLTVSLAPGAQILSEPIFRVPPNSAGLGLVFTHGHWQTGRLVLGDPDSIGHKPTVFLLSR
jgi:hypothetical protein